MTFKYLALFLFTIFTTGCAVGVKHNYENSSLDLNLKTDHAITIGTLDQRPYVLSSRKNSNFVGLSRGGFGNPFNVTTLSGDPLADDISESIATSLNSNNVDASYIAIPFDITKEQAKENLLSKKANKSILIILNEWKGDSLMLVAFLYDISLNIYSDDGQILLTKTYSGKENLGSPSIIKPGGSDQVKARFQSLIEGIFDDKEIRVALKKK